jgi:prevent-host-death family protein
VDIGVKELRNRLCAILDRVARGERIRILRRGKLAAELQPVNTRRRGLPDLSAFRPSIKARGRPTSQLVIDSRCKTWH